MKNLSFKVSEATYQRLEKMAKEFEITSVQVAKELVEGGAESASEIIQAGGIKSCSSRQVVLMEDDLLDIKEGMPIVSRQRLIQ